MTILTILKPDQRGSQGAVEILWSPSSGAPAAPCVGQHSREVFAEELGIGAEEYDALVAAGVTGTLDDLTPPGLPHGYVAHIH